MDKVEFSIGNEKKFHAFISGLDKKDKIALLCHTDLDGIASAKIIEYVIRPDMVKFLDYRSLNNALIEELKNKKINKVIFADLNLESTEFLSEVEKFAEILIIDHHIYAKDLNSDRKTFLSATGYCAAYICYYMFSKIKEIEKFDWLVAAASISDFCYEKNRRWLDKVCKKYGEIFDPSDLTKKNRIYDLALKLSLTALFFKGKVDEAYKLIGDNIEDVANLENYAKDVWNEIEYSMAKFERDKKVFGEIFYWEFKPEFLIKSILINILSMKYKDKTIIIVEDNDTHYEISARRQDGHVNLVQMLERLTYGLKNRTTGGHLCAAGATIQREDLDEFRNRVQKLWK